MTSQDRLQCPNCGANNMAGAAACWQCHMPLGQVLPQPGAPYPFYAARPPRRMSCGLALALALFFMLAGAGLTAYFLVRKSPLAVAPTQDPVERSVRDALGLSPTERALRDLKQSQSSGNGATAIAGIMEGHTKEEVRERLGEPRSIERGYLITEDNRELPREVWRYSYGWIMFRYEKVDKTGRGEPPILRPQPVYAPEGRFR